MPRELWLVIALLAVTGGVLLYDTLPLLPDVVDFTRSSSPFRWLGLFYVVYLLELSSLGVALVGLAHGLYRHRPTARLIAATVCGALVVSYLLQRQRAETEVTVMALAAAAAAVLALAPATRAWFADRSQQAPVRAAGRIAAILGIALGVLGLAALPARAVDGVFGLIAVGFCLGAVLTVRSLGGVRAGQAGARLVLSGAMVGDVVLLLLARSEAPAAHALVVPGVLAAAVVALVWVPPSSQVHFGLAPVKAPHPEPAPPPPPAPVPVAAPPPPPAPAPPPPPETAVHVAVGVVSGSKVVKSSSLQLVYDQESWFPEPGPGEQVIGAYLVLALLHGKGGPSDRVFEGTSTLLITDRRVAGVCPRGKGRQGPLDSTNGPVIPWAVHLADVSKANTATSPSGTYVALHLAGHVESRLLFAKPRIARGDSFAHVDIVQLARDLKRARARQEAQSDHGN